MFGWAAGPAGRVVRSLESGTMDAGPHAVDWDGTDRRGVRVPAGIYLYVLHAGEPARHDEPGEATGEADDVQRRGRERLAQPLARLVVEELHVLVRTLSFQLGRSVDVADVLATAADPEERVRRRELLRMLRES